MAVDTQALNAQAKCYHCYGISTYQGLKLALLAQISTGKNPANDTSPQALLTQGQCFACFTNSDVGQIMELALLQQIAT